MQLSRRRCWIWNSMNPNASKARSAPNVYDLRGQSAAGMACHQAKRGPFTEPWCAARTQVDVMTWQAVGQKLYVSCRIPWTQLVNFAPSHSDPSEERSVAPQRPRCREPSWSAESSSPGSASRTRTTTTWPGAFLWDINIPTIHGKKKRSWCFLLMGTWPINQSWGFTGINQLWLRHIYILYNSHTIYMYMYII
jgi:hypothetical protein